jgi:hypothetical protein
VKDRCALLSTKLVHKEHYAMPLPFDYQQEADDGKGFKTTSAPLPPA